jgi:LPXTG-motif cell wall-anchored protein
MAPKTGRGRSTDAAGVLGVALLLGTVVVHYRTADPAAAEAALPA